MDLRRLIWQTLLNSIIPKESEEKHKKEGRDQKGLETKKRVGGRG
jgi:hypothetical protein